MASVNFKKNTTTAGAAMVQHFTRHDGRENVDYRNKFIRSEWSEMNYCIGVKNPPSASDIMAHLRQRVKEIDAVQPPKRRVKDRVTIMTYTVSAPDNLTIEQERAFFKIAHDEIARFSGGVDNISPGFVHMDEIHEYTATDGTRTLSRAHMHVAGVPYTQEKGVNGKAFETRERMRTLNNAIHKRCKEELGIDFMTGERGLTGRTVEELQAASETRTQRAERERLDNELFKTQNALRMAYNALETVKRTPPDIETIQTHQKKTFGGRTSLPSEEMDKVLALSARVEQADNAQDLARKNLELRRKLNAEISKNHDLQNEYAKLYTFHQNALETIDTLEKRLDIQRIKKDWER